MDDHELTNGYVTVTREDATPAQLFDLAHDMLDRLDGLEWVIVCLALVTLSHLEVIERPEDPRGYTDTLETLKTWLSDYRRDQERIEADRHFMKSPE